MSKLSKYASQPRRPSPLPARRILSVLLLAGGGLLFSLAQLSLQFSVSDLNRETRSLQAQRIELGSQVNRVKGEVARLEQGDRLMQRARELGMVEYVVADVERLQIDPALENQFAIARAEHESGTGENTQPAAEFGRAIAMRLGLEQPAQAGER